MMGPSGPIVSELRSLGAGAPLPIVEPVPVSLSDFAMNPPLLQFMSAADNYIAENNLSLAIESLSAHGYHAPLSMRHW
jgi:hypothetical protein